VVRAAHTHSDNYTHANGYPTSDQHNNADRDDDLQPNAMIAIQAP